jgi:hypothetical protein
VDGVLEFHERDGLKPEGVWRTHNLPFVEQAEDEFLAGTGRTGGGTNLERDPIDRDAEVPVLGMESISNVHVGHILDGGDEVLMNPVGKVGLVEEDAVDAETQATKEPCLTGVLSGLVEFDMDIGRPSAKGVSNQEVDEEFHAIPLGGRTFPVPGTRSGPADENPVQFVGHSSYVSGEGERCLEGMSAAGTTAEIEVFVVIVVRNTGSA